MKKLRQLLRKSFEFAESRLRDEDNSTVALRIAHEQSHGRVGYEAAINDILQHALAVTMPQYSVCSEFSRIDISLIRNACLATTIESKGMVANRGKREIRSPTDIHGINRKLDRDVRKDIKGIAGKIPNGMQCPRFEVFVPVIYELYREGATEEELFNTGKKPWTTHCDFKRLRRNLKKDLNKWFKSNYPGQFKLLHSVESVELLDADQIWINQQSDICPWTPISEAYVSFYAFARFIE